MPFYSDAYLDSLSEPAREALLDTLTGFGNHAQTGDYFNIFDEDRFSGTYVLGVQGVGKSSLLESLIFQDFGKDTAVIVIDPHGDLIDRFLGVIPKEAEWEWLSKIYLFDMQDEAYPFGVNVFSGQRYQTTISQTQAVDRVMHIFEVL